MKQMEVSLRQITKFKYKLTASINMVNEDTLRVLNKAGLYIEKIIPAAVNEFYRESSKTVVTVDHALLARIRQETFVTQEALIIEDVTAQNDYVQEQNIFADPSEPEPPAAGGAWDGLRGAFSEEEIMALAVIYQGNDIKAFADECGIMIEVLIDRINEKATDYIGDSIVDEGFAIYDDYKDIVRDLIA
jgi:hypothetical protein